MTIDITCPSCKSRYKVKDELAGRAAQCKKCGTKITIERPAADPYAMYLDPDDEAMPRKLAEPADDEAADASRDAGTGAEEACPVCHAPLRSDLCMACGFELSASGEPYEDADAAKERREEELRTQDPDTAALRISRWIILATMILAVIVMVGFGSWWVVATVTKSGAHGRIEALVQSIQSEEGSPTQAGAELAAEITYLPSYLESLSARADHAKASNMNVEGLQFASDGGYPQFHMRYSRRVVGLISPMSKDVPSAWRDAAAVSTLIVNLPANSDITPLMHVNDTVGLIAVPKLFGLRKDLNWKLEKSCDADENIRRFAARLLLDDLNVDVGNNATALESLSKPVTPAEKRQVFGQLQEKFSADGAL